MRLHVGGFFINFFVLALVFRFILCRHMVMKWDAIWLLLLRLVNLKITEFFVIVTVYVFKRSYGRMGSSEVLRVCDANVYK